MPKGKRAKLSEEYLDYAVEAVADKMEEHGYDTDGDSEFEEVLKDTLRELFE